MYNVYDVYIGLNGVLIKSTLFRKTTFCHNSIKLNLVYTKCVAYVAK